jgi:hypothetical protein
MDAEARELARRQVQTFREKAVRSGVLSSRPAVATPKD